MSAASVGCVGRGSPTEALPPTGPSMRAAAKTSFSDSPAIAILASSTVMTRFLVLASSAALVDLLTKGIAAILLGDGRVVGLTSRVGLMLIYNTGVTGGASLGPLTGGLNVLTTSIAIAMVVWIVRPLASVDPRATLALSLVTGGALGNLASMLVGPSGVADFLAVRVGGTATVVMNVADLLLWGGALMLAPVVLTLLRAVRAQRALASSVQNPM